MNKQHNYKALKDSASLRNKIWSDLNLSGSKFKEWVMDPAEFVENKPKEFTEFVKKKMESGRLLEPVIFELANSRLGEFYEFEQDKRTFESLDFPDKIFANVDGFATNKETGEKLIVEIKNTTNNDIENMVETYYFQLLFYAWFFNIKKVLFINFVNGWDLKSIIVEFTDAEFEKVWNSAQEFVNFFFTNQLPTAQDKKDFNQVDDEKLTQAINNYLEINEKTKLLNNELKRHKEIIKTYMVNNNLEKARTNQCSISFKKQVRKSLNKDKLGWILAQELDWEVPEINEVFRKAEVETVAEILKVNILGEKDDE